MQSAQCSVFFGFGLAFYVLICVIPLFCILKCRLIVLDAKLMERFPENEGSGKSGTLVNFDEPHEWLAMLSSSDQQPSRPSGSASTQQTPRMTPKKTIRSNVAHSEHPPGIISPSGLACDEKIQTASDATLLPQTTSFRAGDESATEDVTASVVVDINSEEMQLTDVDGSELSGVMVSLNFEVESADVSVPSSDEAIDTAVSPTKASGSRSCKKSAVSSLNCTMKHAHSCGHSHKTGMFEQLSMFVIITSYLW